MDYNPFHQYLSFSDNISKSNEMDMVMSDLERANERASSAEREVEKLKQQLVTITNNLTQSQQTPKGPDMEHAIDILQRSSLEVELAAKEKEQHVANAMATSIYHEMARYNSFQNSHPISTTNTTPSANTISNGISEHRGCKRKHSENERSYKREPSYEGDVSFKEMVERIYRQELMKLAQAARNIAAVTLYRQELSRLAHNSQVRHHDEREPGELRRARDEPDGISVKTEPPNSTSDDLVSDGPIDLSKHSNSKPTTPTSSGSEKSLNSNSAHPTASAFFLVRPNANGHDKFDNHPPPTQPNVGPFSLTEYVSPLQQMQNIVNSLVTRSHVGPPITKSMKAVLPPITQEEFDKYSNMNTDDLVKKVKETLSQYSISQRLFGESVLGFSQGSVRNLLARPKPWHMLTQKGRKPFIRMQLFLEDAEAIPKLVASQYHIPPDKLMRSQSVNKEPMASQDSSGSSAQLS